MERYKKSGGGMLKNVKVREREKGEKEREKTEKTEKSGDNKIKEKETKCEKDKEE